MQHKKNILKATVSGIIISSVPFYNYGFNLQVFFMNFIIVFIGMMIGCTLIDLICQYKELKGGQNGI